MPLVWKTLNSFSRLLFLTAAFIYPAAGQYRFDQWTADSGLPQNSVYGITQTRDGYLWLATVDGLVRFDGIKFTVFNKSNSPGIINNRFTNLFEAPNGDLWAVTEDRGLTLYSQGRFTNYDTENKNNLNNIQGIWGSDTDGNLLVISNDKVYRFSNGQFSEFNEETVSSTSNSPTTLTQKVPAYCNINWKSNQINCIVNGRLAKFTSAEPLPPNLDFRGSIADIDGSVWIFTADNDWFHLANGQVTKVSTIKESLPETSLLLITGARLSILGKDAQGALWRTDVQTMQKELLTRQPPPSLIEFYSAYEDVEGNIWLGSLRSGLFRVRKQDITAYSKADGILENNVYPIFEDRQGIIWIGTTKGIFKYQNEAFTLVKGSENFYVDALAEDTSSRLLASSTGGLYILEEDKFKLLYQNPFGANWAIHSDHENALWIGSQGALIRIKDNVTTTFTTKEGLAGNNIKVIIDAQDGGIWIGTYSGLSHYKDGKFTSWAETADLTIRSLYQDKEGVLWIGTYDSGITRFKDGKFTHYTTKNGLYNDGAFQILEDDQRNFWITSNRGIYRVRKDELNEFAEGKRDSISSIAYGKSDGMLNVECNGGRMPGGIKSRDGRLWFPTQDGVAVVNPLQVTTNPKPPPVVIEDIRIDNKPISNPKSQIQIEPNQQNFEINYTALSFINSENLRFKYKLEGLDTDWVDAGTRRLAYFPHVPPGDYTFRVIAANSDNVWNEEGVSLKIVVLPPFYRTWWFIILAAFGIVLSAFLLFRLRVGQINRKHTQELAFSRRLIDSQEQERKRFAAEMHDGIGQSLVIIKNRARLSLKQADDQTAMLDHLENISDTASHAIHEAKEIAFNLRPHLLDRLGLTKTIESMLGKAFGASGIEFEAEIDEIDNLLEKDSEILLYRIVQECVNNIVKHSQAKKAALRIVCDEKTLTVNISDDGCGFDPSDDDLSKRSFGLVGIAERTRLLGGKLNIESKTGQGTNVSIIIGLT